MSRKRTPSECVLSMLVIIAGLLSSASAAHAQRGVARQAQVLADLVVKTVSCSTHPCIGESANDVRQLLRGRLVSDGYFDYSDLAASYPSVRGVLQGVVEWNLEAALDDISLIIVDFQVSPSALREELERTLPGCEIEVDSEDHDSPDDQEATGSPTTEWECSVNLDEDHEFDITLHLAPELVIVEIES